ERRELGRVDLARLEQQLQRGPPVSFLQCRQVGVVMRFSLDTGIGGQSREILEILSGGIEDARAHLQLANPAEQFRRLPALLHGKGTVSRYQLANVLTLLVVADGHAVAGPEGTLPEVVAFQQAVDGSR